MFLAIYVSLVLTLDEMMETMYKDYQVICSFMQGIYQHRSEKVMPDNCLSDRISHDVNFFVEFGRKLDVIRDINSTSRLTSPGPLYNTIATRDMIPQPL